jgi:hypothetical protein
VAPSSIGAHEILADDGRQRTRRLHRQPYILNALLGQFPPWPVHRRPHDHANGSWPVIVQVGIRAIAA